VHLYAASDAHSSLSISQVCSRHGLMSPYPIAFALSITLSFGRIARRKGEQQQATTYQKT